MIDETRQRLLEEMEQRLAEMNKRLEEMKQCAEEMKQCAIANVKRQIYEMQIKTSMLVWRNKRKDLLEVHDGLSRHRRVRKSRPKLSRII